MSRKKIVAGNWKMNNDLNESNSLIKDLLKESNNAQLSGDDSSFIY
tara:strand:+ start:1194 stop:1331 length:138 start_codon:yes stop_codon:yes gene_type:complete